MIAIDCLPEAACVVLEPDENQGSVPRCTRWGGREPPPDAIWLSQVRGTRRKVTVTIYRWQTHYHVTIEEDRDWWWDADEEVWSCPHSHESRTFRGYYAQYRFVEPFITRTIHEYFPRKMYWVHRDRPTTRRHVYSRNGD